MVVAGMTKGGVHVFSRTRPADVPAPDRADAALQHLERTARRYYAPLVSFFRKRTRNSPEAQDLVQQVFLRLSQHPDVGAIRDPDAYIFQTASNTLRDHWRRTQVRERFVGAELTQLGQGESPPADFSAERVFLGRESMTRVVAALRALPERTRDVFTLRCFEGLRNAEIAQLHGISVRAVEKHVAKALAHVSQVME